MSASDFMHLDGLESVNKNCIFFLSLGGKSNEIACAAH